jgi:hypothetical protein
VPVPISHYISLYPQIMIIPRNDWTFNGMSSGYIQCVGCTEDTISFFGLSENGVHSTSFFP